MDGLLPLRFLVPPDVCLFLVPALLLCFSRSQALPMQPPDAASCKPQYSAKFKQTVDCCLGDTFSNVPVKNLSASSHRPGKLRVRKPAHLLDEEEKEKLNRAYQLMQALPDGDPRSFAFQARLHCFYTYPAMRTQVDYPTVEYNVHLNWLFHPYHRLMTYFHERILASLIGDEDLAIPFWNWDNQTPSRPFPNAIPPVYQDSVRYPALFDPNRGHSGDQIADLTSNSALSLPYQDDDELRAVNNELLHRVMVLSSRVSPFYFFSTPIHPGESGARADRPDCYMEEFEGVIHGGVHLWTGVQDSIGRDMGAAWTAAKDPIFYAHHSNVDRLWTVWRTLDGGRPDLDYPDWLDSEFLFYDEHADLVRVTVRDALCTDALGYTYSQIDNPWIEQTQVVTASHEHLTLLQSDF